jgi:hypothetical protein
MNQRAITPYLAEKGPSVVEIDADRVATLGPELVNYPSVTHSLRQAKIMTSKPSTMFLKPNRSSMIEMKLFYSP